MDQSENKGDGKIIELVPKQKGKKTLKTHLKLFACNVAVTFALSRFEHRLTVKQRV